jgi:hypothetical protein
MLRTAEVEEYSDAVQLRILIAAGAARRTATEKPLQFDVQEAREEQTGGSTATGYAI